MSDDSGQFEQAYDDFIRTVRESGQVWGLFSEQEQSWAICPSASYEDTDVFPFWSSEQAAASVCTDEWKIYQPQMIPLEDFQIDWLPGMHEDDALVGPEWDSELNGLEIEPADLAKELEWEE